MSPALRVRPLKSFGAPVLDALGPMPYLAQQQLFDAGFPTGAFYYTKADFLADLSDAAIEIFVEFASKKPSPMSGILVQTGLGAASRVAPDATAFAHRRLPYAPVIVSAWLDAADSEKNIRWARECWTALHAHAGGGVYVNDLGPDDADRVRTGYGANYDRLAALKQKYDPANFFRFNPNIKPAG